MLFNIEFWNMEEYLPTKRHKKLRKRYVKNSVDVEIKEVTKKEFPIAFIVKDYGYSYEDEGKEPRWGMNSIEIRTHDGKLWKAIRYSEYVCNAVGWLPISYIKRILEDHSPYWKGGEDYNEKSIVKKDNITECIENILKKADDYIIYDGKVWKISGEPMYNIITFGLGHNHGGTGFFIQYHYNSNISNKNYFNALERDKAIAYGKQVALNRGDTKSIDGMGEHNIIEVLMPEMVKRNPQKDHGEGDSFINSLENMIISTHSNTEAGLLAVAMCMDEITSLK